PSAISEGAASLTAGIDRGALSFLVDVEESGTVRSWEVTPSRIRVTARLTYEDTDRLIALGGGAPGLEQAPGEISMPAEAVAEAVRPALLSGLPEGTAPALAHAARLARTLLERRAEAGALILKGPDLDVKVEAGHVR